MNKGELIDAVASKAGLSSVVAKKAVDGVFSEITKALKKRNSVVIVGFGTFSVTQRSSRIGRNPKTGEEIKIKARKSPKFKAGKTLKDSVK